MLIAGKTPAQAGSFTATADIFSTLMLRLFGNILTVNNNLALIYRENTGNRIQRSRFAGTITADNCSKITGLQMQR